VNENRLHDREPEASARQNVDMSDVNTVNLRSVFDSILFLLCSHKLC
jgi:hypothetical protein